MDKIQAVRDAALAFQAAIKEAELAGYHVNWPGRSLDLDKLEISETAKVAAEEPLKAPEPAFARRRPLPEPGPASA